MHLDLPVPMPGVRLGEPQRRVNTCELGVMLQDLAGGEEPTDEEKSFVLKAADESDNKVDGYISK